MTPLIRQAVLADVPALVSLYTAMTIETALPGQGLSTDWQADSDKHLRELAQRPDALVLVADAAGEVIGYEIAALVGHGTVRIVSIYLTPDHRRGRLAVLLLNDAIAWGIAHGCEWCDCQTNLNSVVHRGLEIRGFRVARVELRKPIGER